MAGRNSTTSGSEDFSAWLGQAGYDESSVVDIVACTLHGRRGDPECSESAWEAVEQLCEEMEADNSRIEILDIQVDEEGGEVQYHVAATATGKADADGSGLSQLRAVRQGVAVGAAPSLRRRAMSGSRDSLRRSGISPAGNHPHHDVTATASRNSSLNGAAIASGSLNRKGSPSPLAASPQAAYRGGLGAGKERSSHSGAVLPVRLPANSLCRNGSGRRGTVGASDRPFMAPRCDDDDSSSSDASSDSSRSSPDRHAGGASTAAAIATGGCVAASHHDGSSQLSAWNGNGSGNGSGSTSGSGKNTMRLRAAELSGSASSDGVLLTSIQRSHPRPFTSLHNSCTTSPLHPSGSHPLSHSRSHSPQCTLPLRGLLPHRLNSPTVAHSSPLRPSAAPPPSASPSPSCPSPSAAEAVGAAAPAPQLLRYFSAPPACYGTHASDDISISCASLVPERSLAEVAAFLDRSGAVIDGVELLLRSDAGAKAEAKAAAEAEAETPSPKAARTRGSAATDSGNSSSGFANGKLYSDPCSPSGVGTADEDSRGGGSSNGEVMFNLCISRASAINQAWSAALQVGAEEVSFRNSHVACR